jgi:hypothetical protein
MNCESMPGFWQLLGLVPQFGGGSPISALKVVGMASAASNNAEASTISFLFTAESPFQGELRRDNVRKALL